MTSFGDPIYRKDRDPQSTRDDAYDAQLERSQEDWLAEKRGEVRCEVCDGNGWLADGECFRCRSTGFVPQEER